MRLVTMADDGYVPGLAALLQSIVENSGLRTPTMTVVMTRPLPRPRRQLLATLGVSLEFVDLRDLGGIEPRPNTARLRRMTLQKLLLFELPGTELMLHVDSDMLCVGSLDGLDALPEFAAVPQRGFVRDLLPDGSPMYNTGLFTFRPDAVFAKELREFYWRSPTPFDLGDQVVLNRFLREGLGRDFFPLDESWNTLTWAAAADGRTSVEGIRFLHYVGRKPWRNVWVGYDRGGRTIVRLYELWWEYLERSGIGRELGLKTPPFAAVRLAHSPAIAPAWRLTRRLWLGARAAMQRRVISRTDGTMSASPHDRLHAQRSGAVH
jgi:lipopolysaccharide biosynthesis glycosyltransferase